MELDALATLGKLCPPNQQFRALQLARELTQLARTRHVSQTPIVLVRLEEFLVMYYIVQGIETDLRDIGLYVLDGKPESQKLNPTIELAAKARERLNKSIKELEAVLKAEGATGPTSIAELMSNLRDEYEREERENAAA